MLKPREIAGCRNVSVRHRRERLQRQFFQVLICKGKEIIALTFVISMKPPLMFIRLRRTSVVVKGWAGRAVSYCQRLALQQGSWCWGGGCPSAVPHCCSQCRLKWCFLAYGNSYSEGTANTLACETQTDKITNHGSLLFHPKTVILKRRETFALTPEAWLWWLTLSRVHQQSVLLCKMEWTI